MSSRPLELPEPILKKKQPKNCDFPGVLHAEYMHDTTRHRYLPYITSVLIAWDVTWAVNRSELIGRGAGAVRSAHVRWVDARPTRNDGIISWWYCVCVLWASADCEMIGGCEETRFAALSQCINYFWCEVWQSCCQGIYQIRSTIGCKSVRALCKMSARNSFTARENRLQTYSREHCVT